MLGHKGFACSRLKRWKVGDDREEIINFPENHGIDPSGFDRCTGSNF